MKRIYSFRESFLFSKILKDSRRIFELFGYRYIRLPSFDTETIRKNFISVLNTRENENLYLRSDFTNQIIKHFDSIGEVSFPLKVYYEGSLFLPEIEDFETYQLGIELIGTPGYLGDFEVILCIYTLLKELGIGEFKIVLGLPLVVDEIINKFGESKGEVENLIKRKNLSGIRERFGKESLLEKLIFMQGKRDIVEKASKEFPFIKDNLENLYNLSEKIENLLKADYVIDLSQVRKLPYYNGVTFEFISNYGGLIFASGGRYDGIYYEEIPATGGAIYADNIVSAIKDFDTPKEGFLIVIKKDISEGLLNIINVFINNSLPFSMIFFMDFENLKTYAIDSKFRYILFYEELKVYDTEEGKWTSFKSINEFFNSFNIT